MNLAGAVFTIAAMNYQRQRIRKTHTTVLASNSAQCCAIGRYNEKVEGGTLVPPSTWITGLRDRLLPGV